MDKLLEVKNLTLKFKTDEGLITAVEDVNFSLNRGEVMGLVGESGSGKSVTAKSLMNLNAANAIYNPESTITFNSTKQEVDVLSLKRPADLKVVRGGSVSMIFQEPMASFAPSINIGKQMIEHSNCTMIFQKKEHERFLSKCLIELVYLTLLSELINMRLSCQGVCVRER